MFKKIALSLFILSFMVLLVQVPLSDETLAGQVQVPDSFTFNDDASTGHLSVENNSVKVVWHYKAIPSEYSNRSGGSIYELYDKRTDPGMTRNLVAEVNSGGSGTTPNYAGIGGLGATHVWELGRSVSASDVGKYSRLDAWTNYLDADGNAVFEASFIVSSSLLEYTDANRPDNYRVTKKWTVHPGGQIKLDISMIFLRSFYAAEPAYDFSFSRDYGWTSAVSNGHGWDPNNCLGSGSNGVTNPNNYDQVINNINNPGDHDYQVLHSQSMTFYGQSGDVSARIKIDNDSRGFDSGGIFSYGMAVWGDHTLNPTVEFSSYSQRAYGHTVRYFAWWGGSPPENNRHRLVSAGDTWSDTLWIEMLPGDPPAIPEIVGDVAVGSLRPTDADVSWSTSAAADSKITYWEAGQPASGTTNPSWTPVHNFYLTDLKPVTTYQYEVKSKDGSGEVVKAGSFTTTGADGVFLDLAQESAQWLTYNDYLIHKLTVGFDLTNIGVEDAISTQAIDVSASMGVSGYLLETDVGPIPSGGHGQLYIAYVVPPGVNTFMTTVYLSANDGAGNEYFFPDVPVG